MPAIPPFVLKKLYVSGSLKSEAGTTSLRLKNVIAPGTITGITGLVLDGQDVDLARVSVAPHDAARRSAVEISGQAPLDFPLGAEVTLAIDGARLETGSHELVLRVVAKDVGPLQIPISDALD